MSGYLILASDEWCDNIQKHEDGNAVFWRKRKTFKAIENGEYIYFMSRKNANQSRCIVGRGLLKESTAMRITDAWEQFGVRLGSPERKGFIDSIAKVYGSSDLTIGCLLLENVEFLDNPVSIIDFGIVYQNGTVSGKTLSEEECKIINDSFRRDKENGR